MIHTHSSPNIIRIIKPRIMRLAGHVERMGGRTGTYRVWRGDLTERDHLQDLDVDGMIKMDVQEVGWGVTDWIDLAQDRNR
jgi:hypothetical protein